MTYYKNKSTWISCAFFIPLFFILISCRKSLKIDSLNKIKFKNLIGKIEIINSEKDSQALQIIWNKKDTAQWELPYPIYHLEIADFNNDGNDEVFVGVIKKTRYDTTFNKRIFIFKIVDFEIRPLWMGSKVGNFLLNFTTISINDTTYIRTHEVKNETDTLIGYYIHAPFGIEWIKYEK